MLTKQVGHKHDPQERRKRGCNPRKLWSEPGVIERQQNPGYQSKVDDDPKPKVLTCNVWKKVIIFDVERQERYRKQTEVNRPFQCIFHMRITIACQLQ